MRENDHGGDTYRYGKKIIDLSANIAPIGAPPEVIRAFAEADISQYPDPYSTRLRGAIAERTGADAENIICGSGAASLIYTLAAYIKPRLTLAAAPSFSEYERAARSAGSEIIYYGEAGGANEYITDGTDLVFICVPNNPTGTLTEHGRVEETIVKAAEHGALVVVDECFNDFLDEPERYTVLGLTEKYDNLAVLRSFTKMYAMPGLRLGYMVCSNARLLDGMYSCRQPWELSAPAEAAGIAACAAAGHAEKVRGYVRRERGYLTREFERLGIEYKKPSANFIFFHHRPGLKERLLSRGILIRACGNYRGLDGTAYRTAVKTHEENVMLIRALEDENG